MNACYQYQEDYNFNAGRELFTPQKKRKDKEQWQKRGTGNKWFPTARAFERMAWAPQKKTFFLQTIKFEKMLTKSVLVL